MKNRLTLTVIVCFGFQLLQAQFGQDCASAINICTKRQYKIEDMSSFGDIQERDANAKCFNAQFKETNSKWLRFKIQEPGELYFTIDPLSESDDIDFIVYKVMTQGCASKQIVRCMASGSNIGSRNPSTSCTGSTGLRPYDMDRSESTGCNDANDNFLSSILSDRGDEYLLLINNYNNSDGFYFELKGDAILQPSEECLPEPNHLTAFQVIPNPVSDIALASFSSNAKDRNGRIELLDYNGKQVLIKTADIEAGQNEMSIDLSDLPKGPYSLKLSSKGNFLVETLIKI